ncbi:hypothetical protein CYY_000352 [Polysphondylium violaceum]|uniref:Phospholipid-transporting ATPase n=1 Tax=Polysphondylium violaceum TaxID=133409 RepID=A0A8J4Q1S2_9MYCE|nr:hypothetical protein CYY_000352 [Polysphondylium violaceum]
MSLLQESINSTGRRNSISSNSSGSPFLQNSTSSATSPYLHNSTRMNPHKPHTEIPLKELKSSNKLLIEEDPDQSNKPFFQKLWDKIVLNDYFIGDGRTIHINNNENNKIFGYSNNYVRTSKYTLLTFLPLNLFEQFCRLANIYFLIISALQLIPNISPTGKYTTLGPLLVVLAITGLKEAYEDFRRHRQDRFVNESLALVLKGNKFELTKWKDIQVGDIVKVLNKQYLPTDLVILSSSEPQSMCYIETGNLDGETNLKIRQGLEETCHLVDEESLSTFNGLIECEHPNNKIYSFSGSLHMDSKILSLSVKQVLLRGTMLRNTKWITGVTIFTGRDTKLMRNSNVTPLKRSGIEKSTNFYIIFIFFLQILLCAGCAIANGIWNGNHRTTEPSYIYWIRTSSEEGALSFLTFLILFNNLIPISLYVSMEFVKLIQALFINSDIEMYHKETDTPALARTSNLNEELGQIQYIFTDKTGTLTQNKMVFKKCSIAGVSYGTGVTEATMGAMIRQGKSLEDIPIPSPSSNGSGSGANGSTPFVDFNDDRLIADLGNSNNSEQIRDFMFILSVCHTVIPEVEEDKLIYQASSPDECALVNAARYFGFTFTRRTPRAVFIEFQGQEYKYDILNVLEFNSTRKRMSVIVRTPSGKLLLYCKGADSVIFERLSPGQPYADVTINHLQDFATEGLRTLCIATTELDEQIYQEWNKEFDIANTCLVDRELQLERVAETIERNLFLIGATAIEDKLQEGVPETIDTLLTAGIKIWVLTGDKQETAINIGFSCQLLNQQMELLVINEQTKENTIIELNRRLNELSTKEYEETRDNLALIIDGTTLNFALDGNIKISLLKLAKQCRAVICCRVSPLQKSKIVSLVKDSLNVVTLAIGDGANDVSMIQAAHVGIGISGEEGLQAARSSDYAIAQFRFLSRLLLVHGRYSYRRISRLICYCFYKNICLYITQFWFTILNGWSGQTLYERFTLTAYNIAWTLVPIIALGALDKDVNESVVLEHPQLYQSGPRRDHFNIRVFWGWVANGVYHSFILFAFPTLIFRAGLPFTAGKAIDLFSIGTVAFSCIVLTVNIKLALETRYWTWINHVAIWGSIVIYFMWLVIFGKFWEVDSLDVGSDLYSIIYHLGTSAVFYFSILIVPVIALWRDFTWKFIHRSELTKPYHVAQELQKSSTPKKSIGSKKKSGYTGYSFSQDSGQADALKKFTES